MILVYLRKERIPFVRGEYFFNHRTIQSIPDQKLRAEFSCRNHAADDDDDHWEGLSRKLPSHYKQHLRRRLPKRYSDIVSPSSTRIFLSRKESINRDRPILPDRSSAHLLRRHSMNPINETMYFFNQSRRKSRDPFEYRQHHMIKHNDHLAHRMQAAMSSELMSSLDRNLIVNERRQLVPRSHSFNVTSRKPRRVERKYSYHFLPRVKLNFNKRNIFFNQLMPKEEVLFKTNQNKEDLGEEPTIDYDDSKTMLTTGESEDKTITQSDQGASSSFIVPQTSIESTNELESTPPIPPPPLLNLTPEQTTKGFRCRTIADKLSADHKLILKDQGDEQDQDSSGEYY